MTINCKGKLLALDKPVVMGILNLTTDSFYKGLLAESTQAMVDTAGKMIDDGATIIDIGGQSTRPGSERVGASEERDRVVPAIESIRKAFPEAVMSIDTYHASVAWAAVESGAHIINDVSAGLLDDDMLATVVDLGVPYICMHMLGTPEDMQQNPSYENVTEEVLDFLLQKIAECRALGIIDIIIDPGFGFGKTTAHNYELMKNLPSFKMAAVPLLVGVSRKGMVYKTIGRTAAEALAGTTALNMIALQNGANILRVHDVAEAMDCIKVWEAYDKV
jgi:dihydropteroate synthase